MTNIQGSANWPEDFSGKVRLFPLPNVVLFPHVVQHLHIFEPRYCDMLHDALADDKLIAMALLEKGWQNTYQQKPTIGNTICIGKIVSHKPTEDSRHNILLVGMKRARIIEELDTERSFRTAEVELIEDLYPPEDSGGRPDLVEKLQELFARFVPEGSEAQKSFRQLVGQKLPLGILTDTITYAINLPVAIKQQLLAEHNVDIRCRILIRCLEQQIKNECAASESFPPKFSVN